MCAVSMIYDHYNQPAQNPIPQPIPWPTGIPASLPWDAATLAELKKIIERLDALDKRLGLEHCEDPKKAEWMKQVEQRVAALEKKKVRQKR